VVKRRIISLSIFGYFLFMIAVVAALGLFWSNEQAPKEQPTQPIEFPHDIHAGKLAINCVFCHKGVDKSIYASIPNTNVCMTCHQNAAKDRPGVQKLISYYNKQEQVPWKVIHKLPDYVYFSHKRHIKAEIDCASCHGEVKAMKKVRQVRSLSMGFCVTCHSAKQAPKDCWTCHK